MVGTEAAAEASMAEVVITEGIPEDIEVDTLVDSMADILVGTMVVTTQDIEGGTMVVIEVDLW